MPRISGKPAISLIYFFKQACASLTSNFAARAYLIVQVHRLTETATMLKALALTLTVAILMASGFGFTPPQPQPATVAVSATASQISNTALKSGRLDLLHS